MYIIPGIDGIKRDIKFVSKIIEIKNLDTKDPIGPAIEIKNIVLFDNWRIPPAIILNINEFKIFMRLWVPRKKVNMLDVIPAIKYFLNPNTTQIEIAIGAEIWNSEPGIKPGSFIKLKIVNAILKKLNSINFLIPFLKLYH